MAESVDIDNKPVSVEGISLSTQTTDCLTNDSDINSDDEFTADELYKHALIFYKGSSSATNCLTNCLLYIMSCHIQPILLPILLLVHSYVFHKEGGVHDKSP